jgi:hypothetical protein
VTANGEYHVSVTDRYYEFRAPPELDEEILAMTPGERIALSFELTRQWWEIHDPAALHACFRRDIVRVIRLRDYES